MTVDELIAQLAALPDDVRKRPVEFCYFDDDDHTTLSINVVFPDDDQYQEWIGNVSVWKSRPIVVLS